MIKKLKLVGYHKDNINYVFLNFKVRIKKNNNKLNTNEKKFYKNNLVNKNNISKCYFYSKRILVTKYDNLFVNPKTTITPKNLHSVLNKIELMHNSFITSKKTNINFEKYTKNFSEDKHIVDVLQMYKKQDFVFSHNDLGLNNILINKYTNDAKLIDFEYCGYNLKYFDFAHLWISLELNDEYLNQILSFLNISNEIEKKTFLKITYFICIVFSNYCNDKINEFSKYEKLQKKYLIFAKKLKVNYL